METFEQTPTAPSGEPTLDHPVLIPDYGVEFDATDAAHPAWWRGQEHGAEATARALAAILTEQPEREPSFGSPVLNDAVRAIRASLSTERARMEQERDEAKDDERRMTWLSERLQVSDVEAWKLAGLNWHRATLRDAIDEAMEGERGD